MSTTVDIAQVQKALKDAGEGWLISYWGAEADSHLQSLAKQIHEFVDTYSRKFGERPDPFALFQTDPYKARAFFQNDTFMVSVNMKIMIWRILLGAEIIRIKLEYELFRVPSLSITLRTPHGEEEEYAGSGAWDFKVLRHFGAAGAKDGLVLQGYYAARR